MCDRRMEVGGGRLSGMKLAARKRGAAPIDRLEITIDSSEIDCRVPIEHPAHSASAATPEIEHPCTGIERDTLFN